jgi:hypothetical protein
MIRIETEQTEYLPLIFIRAYRGDKLIYRRLTRKENEQKCREEIAALFPAAGG